MTRVRDVTEHIRSKQAGPFWVTLDIWFSSRENFHRYKDSHGFSAATIAALYRTDASLIKSIPVPDLHLIKISYPRPTPQGGFEERDMHSGQQYVRLLDVELD